MATYIDNLQNTTTCAILRGITILARESRMYLKLVDDLAAKGRFSFSFQEFLELAGSSAIAVKAALHRLQKKGEIAMPYRGFYVILPPAYRDSGCLPAPYFVPELMKHIGEAYYTGLMSAAEFQGTVHQAQKVFQVVVARPRRPLVCGNTRIEFIFKKNAASIPTHTIKTPAGLITVASPEATALDVVSYVNHCSGLDNVAALLCELAESLDPVLLVEAAELSPISCAQRLGYLLELIGVKGKATQLADYIRRKRPVPTALTPGSSIKGAVKDRRWQLYVNFKVSVMPRGIRARLRKPEPD